MKKFSVILVLFWAMLVLPTLAQDFDLDETFVSEEGTLSFDYPEDWDIEEYEDRVFLYPDGDDYEDIENVEFGFYYLTDDFQDSFGIETDMDAEEAMEEAVETLGLDADDIDTDDVGDHEVASIAFDDGEFYYIASIVDTDDGLILTQISSDDEDEIDDAEDIYFDILETIELGAAVDLSERYESDNEELTFDYPDDWDIEDLGDEIYVFPDSDDYEDIEDVSIDFIIFNDELGDRFGIDIDDDIDDAADDIVDAFEDNDIEADTDGDIIDIGDYEAVIVMTESPDADVIFNIAVVETDDGLIFVQISGPEDQVEDALAIFYGIIESMEWEP